MEVNDNKLKSCLMEILDQEISELREELRHMEPHVFSEKYRKTIEEAMKRKWQK